MIRNRYKHKLLQILDNAGVTVSGNRPWDIVVHNEEFYIRVLTAGSLGLGESYMEGWWDCDSIDEFICRILRAGTDNKIKTWSEVPLLLKAKICNRQKRSRAFQVGQRHYDIGNDLYQAMLDKQMIYSCGYWDNAADLNGAQENKLDLICRKLDLQPGMKVLDIGCGWGGTARYLAECCRVEVTGITVSEQQAKYAEDLCRGLPITIRLRDYRDLRERFDRVLSIGMFEHVGYKNYRAFMQKVRRCLSDNGLFLLHTIGSNASCVNTDPWIERYIFPNSMLPSARQICRATEDVFVIEDWHNFGIDYDRTLLAWFRNFDRAWNLLKGKYGNRFYRMWKYYLLACAGSFRARRNQVWQIMLSPEGIPGGYCASWRRGYIHDREAPISFNGK